MNDFIPAFGVVIEAESRTLEREAQQKQKEWFANPTSPAAKEEFAKALKRWAKEVGNKKAQKHAESLLQE